MSVKSMVTATTDIRFCTDHLREDLRGRTARSGLVTLISQFARFALNLLSVMVMARLLLPVEYGLIAMVAPITGFVGLFKDLGLSTATVQKTHITHEQVSVLFWINVTVSVVLAVLCVVISPLVGRFYHDSRTIWITMALAFTFVLGGLTAQHHALLKRQMLFVALAWIDIVTAVLSILVGIVTAWLGWSYWSLVAMTLSAGVVNCAGVWIANSWRPGRPRRGSGVREMLRFGGCLTVSQVCGFISGNADKLLIGKTMGANALGIYNRAFQLLLMPLDQIFTPLSAVLLPALSRVTGDPERYRHAVRSTGNLMLMVTIPITGILISLANETVIVFLGPSWMDAVPIFRALAIVAVAIPMNNLGAIILLSSGRTDILMRWAPISMTISIASILMGMPWGLTGIASAWAIGGLAVRTPLYYLLISRNSHVTFRDLISPVLWYAIPFLLILLAGNLLRPALRFDHPLCTLLIDGTILALGYGLFLLATGRHCLILDLLKTLRKESLP